MSRYGGGIPANFGRPITGVGYAPTRQRVIKDPETGVRREVTVPKRIRPWWFVAENGRVCLSVKYGSRTMELAKGESAVEVAGPQELMPLLGRGINNSMTIEEIVREYIRETVKPLTSESRLRAFQVQADPILLCPTRHLHRLESTDA